MWSDILGQPFAVRYLQTHLKVGRVADAYLLTGPDGVGKRRVCLEMAKGLNCAGSGDPPCDACPVCRQISRGMHPDVHLLSPEGASAQIRMDTVRQLLGRIALRPFSAAYQVAILDGADRLTDEAANSLLKSLEEPPAHTRFLLTTSQPSQCLPTIVSRCQVVRCQPLPSDVIRRLLTDGHGVEASRAEAVARCARGSLATARTLLERWDGYQRARVRLATSDVRAWMQQPLPDSREAVAAFLEAMLMELRDLALVAAGGSRWTTGVMDLGAEERLAVRLDLDRCVELAFELLALQESLEQFVSPSLVASLAREYWCSLLEPQIVHSP